MEKNTEAPELLHNNAGFIGTNEQFLNALGVIASRKGTDGVIAAVALEQLARRADRAAPSAQSIEDLTATQTAWYSSNDEEVWCGGPYSTREEAEACAKTEEHRLIISATKGPIRVSKFFDQESFFERAEETLYDVANEHGDPILDFPPEVNLDLQVRVRAAIDEWQVAHKLSPMACRFDSSGPAETAAWAEARAEKAEALHQEAITTA